MDIMKAVETALGWAESGFNLALDALRRRGYVGLSAPLISREVLNIPAGQTEGTLNMNMPITGEIRSWSVSVTNAAMDGPAPVGTFVRSMNIGAVQLFRHNGDPGREVYGVDGTRRMLPFGFGGFLQRIKVLQGQTWQVIVSNGSAQNPEANIELVLEIYGTSFPQK